MNKLDKKILETNLITAIAISAAAPDVLNLSIFLSIID